MLGLLGGVQRAVVCLLSFGRLFRRGMHKGQRGIDQAENTTQATVSEMPFDGHDVPLNAGRPIVEIFDRGAMVPQHLQE